MRNALAETDSHGCTLESNKVFDFGQTPLWLDRGCIVT